MIYNGKPIDTMNDWELEIARIDTDKIYNDVMEKRNSPKFQAKFKNQTHPAINPVFVLIREAIQSEITKRQGEA